MRQSTNRHTPPAAHFAELFREEHRRIRDGLFNLTEAFTARDLPRIRHSEIFGVFEALKAGEGFVLVNDHDSKPLLYQFQAEHPGRFEWCVLEAGPERFRVEIRRRTGEPFRTISDFLGYDHRRLDEILPDVERMTEGGALANAGERFAEFSCGLNRHIDAEEQILFPTFEQLTGMTMGPTTAMRAEHVEIRRCMTMVAATLDAQDVAGAKHAIGQLDEILTAHNMKEEQILYPMADRATSSPRERDDLVRHMQAL